MMGPSHRPQPKARSTPLANTPAWAKRRTPHTEACIDGGTLPQTVPAVQVFHQVKQGLSLALVRYSRVIAPRLNRGQRHPGGQHRSTEAVGLQGHAEPVGAVGQSLKRAGGCVHPVVPVLGSATRPNPFQPLNTAWRREVGQAVFGSVPPKTFPRKSSHLS